MPNNYQLKANDVMEEGDLIITYWPGDVEPFCLVVYGLAGKKVCDLNEFNKPDNGTIVQVLREYQPIFWEYSVLFVDDYSSSRWSAPTTINTRLNYEQADEIGLAILKAFDQTSVDLIDEIRMRPVGTDNWVINITQVQRLYRE
jgi:hypothetical protein